MLLGNLNTTRHHNQWRHCNYMYLPKMTRVSASLDDPCTLILQWGSVKCSLQTYCGKQCDNCCHILICMVKTIVRSLHFTLTDFATDTEVDNINITSPRGIKNWNRVLAYFSYLSTKQWPALVTCDLWRVFCTCQISCFTLICLICTRSPRFTWWFKP